MKKLLASAAAVAALSFAGAANATVYTVFCESGGTNTGYTTQNVVSRCDAGETDVGADIGSYNAGSISTAQGLIFQGSGDNYDVDTWSFTTTHGANVFLDLFSFNGAGKNTGVLQATVSGLNGIIAVLTAGVATPALLTSLAAGTYSVTVTGAGALPTNIYNYDLRVQEVPLPAGALLFGTGLAAFAARRKKRTA